MSKSFDRPLGVSDEDLMAYADGELGPSEMQSIARAIEADPALAARLRVFRLTGRALAPKLDGLVVAAPPAAMLDAIRSTPIGRAAPRPSVLASMRNLLEGFGFTPSSPWPALAGLAAAAIIATTLTWYGAIGTPDGTLVTSAPDGVQVAAGELARVLESDPATAPDGEHSIVAMSTFKAIDGRFCRLYKAPEQAGLACRSTAGAWQVLAIDEGDAGAGADEKVPSGGSGSSAVAELVDEIRTSEAALDPKTEAALIAHKWEAR